MRVAFLAGHLSRRASGVRQVVEGLSGAIAARSVEVKVFGIRDAAWVHDKPYWNGAPAETYKRIGPANFGFTPSVDRAIAAFQPDVVHLHGIWMYSALVASRWQKQTGGSLVISPHGMLAGPALQYSQTRKRLIRMLFQDRCFARTKGFHATAESEAADIRAYIGKSEIAIIPNGVNDTTAALPAFSARRLRVLAIGRLHPVKGYEHLLRGWAQIESCFPGWTLEIAGPDPDGYADVLRALIRDLGLQRALISPPYYGEQRDEAISNSMLFALPSLTENFALTVPEALICGTPVMASTATPWRSLRERGCGWWVDPRPDALALCLREVLSIPQDQLGYIGSSGRKWALNSFNWDLIAEQMIEFYDTLKDLT